MRDRAETTRSTARFDPPVWPGSSLPRPLLARWLPCPRRTADRPDHCRPLCRRDARHGLLDSDGRLIGTFGPAAKLTDCPAGRFCAPSDFLSLALAPDRIPSGHLNLVDMGAGGYRTIDPGTPSVDVCRHPQGRPRRGQWPRALPVGKVLEIGPYEHVDGHDLSVHGRHRHRGDHGDSGAAVLVNGLPAGTMSREISGLPRVHPARRRPGESGAGPLRHARLRRVSGWGWVTALPPLVNDPA